MPTAQFGLLLPKLRHLNFRQESSSSEFESWLKDTGFENVVEHRIRGATTVITATKRALAPGAGEDGAPNTD